MANLEAVPRTTAACECPPVTVDIAVGNAVGPAVAVAGPDGFFLVQLENIAHTEKTRIRLLKDNINFFILISP
jgi:hypothetical protein